MSEDGNRQVRHDDWNAAIFFEPGTDWERCERDLLASGVALPLPHRMAWTRTRRVPSSWFVCVRGPGGVCRFGFAVEVERSRALPGHVLLRIERIGGDVAEPALDAGIAAVVTAARARRVLRVELGSFSRHATERERIGAVAERHGFHRRETPRHYTRTVVLDLAPSEEELLSSFHRSARRNIREVRKHPVEVRPVTDRGHAARLTQLLGETMARTGGEVPPHHWEGIMDLGDRDPALSRLVGLYHTEVGGPEALLAFAWGQAHGDHAVYATSASTRLPGVRVAFSYALVWDLICWAKAHGRSWFDFGGITAGKPGEDPLSGISDFKRYFTQDIAVVGEEWLAEPHRVRAAVARTASAGAQWFRRMRSAIRDPRVNPGAG